MSLPLSSWANPDRPLLSAELLHSFCQNDPAIAKRFARVTFLADNRADVSHCHTPCLLVQCAHDLIAPPGSRGLSAGPAPHRPAHYPAREWSLPPPERAN